MTTTESIAMHPDQHAEAWSVAWDAYRAMHNASAIAADCYSASGAWHLAMSAILHTLFQLDHPRTVAAHKALLANEARP